MSALTRGRSGSISQVAVNLMLHFCPITVTVFPSSFQNVHCPASVCLKQTYNHQAALVLLYFYELLEQQLMIITSVTIIQSKMFFFFSICVYLLAVNACADITVTRFGGSLPLYNKPHLIFHVLERDAAEKIPCGTKQSK